MKRKEKNGKWKREELVWKIVNREKNKRRD